MKLLSTKIENYRIHQSLSVDFDGHRTLIGGPNESGKSTLIEAIHRALFLRHSVGGEIQSSMISTTHGGIPAVEVVFEARGTRYHLKKEFGGTSKGRVTLTSDGQQGLTGDEAESELARILATEGPITGRGAQSQLEAQWAHLWIWQGNSASNPTKGLGNVAGDLIDRLQETGGAVALQSTLDATIASEIASHYSSLYSGRGSRANSPESLAAAEVEEAQAAVNTARERLDRTRRDAERVIQSDVAISRYTDSLSRLRKQLLEVEQKLNDAGVRQTELKERQREFDLANSRQTELDKADKRIAGIARQTADLQKRLKPEQERLGPLRKSRDATLSSRQKYQREHDRAHKAVENARQAKEYADLQVGRLRTERDYHSCEKILLSIRETEATLKELNKRVARLPKIDKKEITVLRKLDQAVLRTKSTLDAIATDIEVLESKADITLNGEILKPGRPRGIDESTELSIGDHTRLRITPGGGTSLEEARQDCLDAEQALNDKLRFLGVESLDGATEIQAELNQLNAGIQAEVKRLEAYTPEETSGNHTRLSRELEAARGRLETLAKQIPDPDQPTTLQEAEQTATGSDRTLLQAIETYEERRDDLTASARRLDSLEADLRTLEEKLRQDSGNLAELQTELRVLTETHGSKDDRRAELAKAGEARTTAESKLKQIRTQLELLNPGQLASDKDRLGRSIEQTEGALQQARNDRAEAKGRLESDGREDPHEVLAVAEVRLQSTQAAHNREVRLGQALQLLNTAFTEEQATLAGQFSRPLAERISAYLQALFGKSVRAQVAFQDNQLAGIELIRDTSTGTFAFDTLSGGTREQVGAAVRIAIAELLAHGHDGVLPVVFDDAFAYSDPERVQELQRMLDLAARNGLQIIILSCNPTDYAGLGAKVVAVG